MADGWRMTAWRIRIEQCSTFLSESDRIPVRREVVNTVQNRNTQECAPVPPHPRFDALITKYELKESTVSRHASSRQPSEYELALKRERVLWVFYSMRLILHAIFISVGVVRRSLESWWHQPTFQRCGLRWSQVTLVSLVWVTVWHRLH